MEFTLFVEDVRRFYAEATWSIAFLIFSQQDAIQSSLFRLTMASNDPPQAAAAAASVQEDDDATLAKKWAAMEQLTQVFGFSADAAKQAIDIVGPDVNAACAFILDAGLGSDQGGPVVPIDNCPHIQEHVNISASDLESFNPTKARCSHFEDYEKESSSSGKGKSKADVDTETGTCNSTENWVCLECGAVRCSRYANGHGLVHWENTKAQAATPVGHCIHLSLSDLSVWCHVCSAYLHHPTLSEILRKMEERKFANTADGVEPDGKKAATNS